MDISNYDKAEVLAALYNNAKPQGLGHLQATPEDMTVEEARGLSKEQDYFDYLNGRVMKVKFRGDNLDTFLYNRDNGDGAAERVIAGLKPNV